MLLVTPALLETAAACSCDGENPPCAAAWQADAVFVGHVIERSSERVGGHLHWTVHKIAVVQTLRGSVDPIITMAGEPPSEEQIAASAGSPGEQWMMGSSCEYGFEVGRRYMVYAQRTRTGGWTTSICSGTKPLERAAADLDYFATIPFAGATGRIYGTLERTVADPAVRSSVWSVPASGITVTIDSGVHRFRVRTDTEGKLDVQVPPGDYLVAPVVPETVRVYGFRRPVRVPARGCAPVYFSLVAHGRLEGRIVRSDGSGAPNVWVDVIPADFLYDELPDLTLAPSGRTDKEGRFVVDPILPGRYVVALNARFGPGLDSPYATTYFSGVGRREADEIDIAEGERKTGFAMTVDPLVETMISGTVAGEDERPIAGARVLGTVVGHKGMITDSATTDGNGVFHLRVLTGVSYLVTAAIRGEKAVHQAEAVVHVGEENAAVRLFVGP